MHSELDLLGDGIQEEVKVDYSTIHKQSVIDISIVQDRPPLAISIGVDPKSYAGVHFPLRFGTFGNISMIKGEEKARKSFLKSLILACSFGGNSNLFTNGVEIVGHDLQDKYIFNIDTEQDDYDAWLNAKRIPEIVGKMPENYVAIKLRDKSPKERLGYLEWLFYESEYRNKLGVTAIDGFVDCVDDFNSLTESTSFTQFLMKASSVTKSHITGILHLNPGSDKARGHLGTILQQKCETVVIIKDLGDYSEVIIKR